MNILKTVERKIDEFHNKEILLIGIIMTIGVILRIIITPWELPSKAPDVIVFFTEAYNFSYNNYDLLNPRFFWPFFLSVFFRFFEFNTYIEYVNVIRIISIGVSVVTIPVIYLIGRKFLEKNYSILVASFFAFNFHIIDNSTWGITEPLFLLLSLSAFYFLLNYNSKFTILSFILSALAFDTRTNGIVILIIILIGYSVKVRPLKKLIILCSIGLTIFVIISIPNYYEFDTGNNPLTNRITSTGPTENQINPHLFEVAKLFFTSEELDPNSDNYRPISSFENYIFAMIKETYHFIFLHIQFLIFVLPIGIYSIFRNKIWKEWLLICVTCVSFMVAIPQYTLSSEVRNLFLILPMVGIISTIGIKNLINKSKKKNWIIGLIIFGLICSSIVILYEKTETELIQEKEKFGKFVSNNFSGIITGDLLYHVENNLFDLSVIPLEMKKGKTITTDYSFFSIITEEKLILFLKERDISYVIIDNVEDNRYPIFQDVFNNEKKYPYLTKVYDSKTDFEILEVKIFKVDFNG